MMYVHSNTAEFVFQLFPHVPTSERSWFLPKRLKGGQSHHQVARLGLLRRREPGFLGHGQSSHPL